MTSPNPEPQAPDGASLAQLLIILRRRWRLLAAVWLATVAVVAVYTFTSTRLYRPQATLEIRPEMSMVSSGSADDPAFMASRMMWENYYRTQEAILTSPSLIDAVLKALPDVGRIYLANPDPAKSFAAKIDIEKVRTSFILKVGFVDEDGKRATDVVNTLVRLYIEDANRRLRELKSGAVEVMSKETLPAIRKRVEDADQVLQDFQASTGYTDFEEHHRSLIENRRVMESRLTQLLLKRAKDRAELQALSAYGGGDGVSGLFNPAFHSTRSLEPLALERAKLGSDLAKEEKLYKERHPRLIELREQLRMTETKIREAIQGTLKALESELAAVEGEAKSLAAEVAIVEKSMADAAKNLNRFKRLDAELLAAKEVYNSYLKKHGETSATTGASLGSVRVVDDATPPQAPFKPRILMNLALGNVIGLLLAIGAIFVTEQLDDRIQSPREVEAFVGLDVVAVIPRLSEASKAGEGPILLDEHSALPEFEAFRALRAEVVTRLEKVQGAKVVCVLSALQSEGKSTVTANLAKVLSMEGRRVLVFDADLRRPSQRSLIGAADGPGLEDVLRGAVSVEKAVQRSRIAGVDILSAGGCTSGAAELAGSLRFEEALAWGRANYDVVLIDSAPVNQVSESPLIARRADVTLLVVREGETSRGAVIHACRRLKTLDVKLIGAILNCAQFRGSTYGYGGSYYSYYGERDG